MRLRILPMDFEKSFAISALVASAMTKVAIKSEKNMAIME
jgi:hypothetical protein